ncbi:MAG: glycoside hydrolase family 5 [Alphaproteobacteria bacterium]|nr:MAG: glycoside hydrolase family 5 [Alphaproteobacteria bacterium]
MRTAILALIAALAATPVISAPLELHRGVAVHEWLNWSPLDADGTYRWPPYRTQDEWLSGARPASDWAAGDKFELIRSLGFDFIRLTVDPGPLLSTEGDKRQEALALLARDVAAVTTSGLKVVFNIHPVTQVMAYSNEVVNGSSSAPGVAQYRDMIADLARTLAPLGVDKVAIEPFNEPAHYPCDMFGSNDWQEIMASTVAAIRAVSTEITIVATGACGGNVDGVTDLDPSFDDPNILYSFHMYEPHLFTHQRAEVEGDFASGLPWPASEGTPEAARAMLGAHMDAAGVSPDDQGRQLAALRGYIDAYFSENWGEPQMQARVKQAVDWATSHGIPTSRLFMGEFGAMLMSDDGRSGAFDADRLRYLETLRKIAEGYGIPWSVWEFSNPYGMSIIKPKGPALPDLAMLKALGL